MQDARREHPRFGAVTDEQRRSRPGAAPPRRAGAISFSGFVSPQSQSPDYAPSSCLARKRNRLQQNRNLFLHRPLSGDGRRHGARASRATEGGRDAGRSLTVQTVGLTTDRPENRSADFQSAVSPISNRPGAGKSQRARTGRRPAEYNSAIRQSATLRYELCRPSRGPSSIFDGIGSAGSSNGSIRARRQRSGKASSFRWASVHRTTRTSSGCRNAPAR